MYLHHRVGRGLRQPFSICGFLETASRRDKRRAIRALCLAARASGHAVRLSHEGSYEPCDVAVVWGSPKDRARSKHDLKREIAERHKGPVIVLETPLLGRNVVARNSLRGLLHRRLGFYRPYDEFRAGLGGVTRATGDFCLESIDPLRLVQLRKRLALPAPAPYRKSGEHIVVFGQTPGDASLDGIDINQWIVSNIRRLLEVSKRRIVLRLHPRALTDAQSITSMLGPDCGVLLQNPARVSLGEALDGAWAAVTYSSGAAIDALMRGVPVVAMSPGSFAYDVAEHSVDTIEAPQFHDREPWLNRLAHCQWSLTELREGTAWRRFETRLLAGTDAVVPQRQPLPAH
jgi:hypothetical protein